MQTPKYPPYVNAYGNINKLLSMIKTASVPAKITNDYFSTVLGLKSSSYRPMIPLLRKLGFIDQGNAPTQRYKDFRSESKSGFVMAKAIKEAYSDLYQGNEYAEKLGKKDLSDLVCTRTGAAKDDRAVAAVVGTFCELVKHATFDVSDIPEEIVENNEDQEDIKIEPPKNNEKVKLGISYTINLNLPSTTEVKVFDAIFKSLRKNLLDNQSLE